MVRTQIQLRDEQARALKRLAAERGQSMAELVREGVEIVLRSGRRQGRWERALDVVGAGAGPAEGGVSEAHDEHLADAFQR